MPAGTAFTGPSHLQVRSILDEVSTRVEIHLPGPASLGVDATILRRGEHHLTAADLLFARDRRPDRYRRRGW